MKNVGDVVVLNSGGAAMTVIAVDGSRLQCAWMDDKGEYDQVWLPAECVRRAP